MVRLDRGAQEICVKYEPGRGDWQPVDGVRKLSRPQIVQVAFEADKALLRQLGDHAKARRDWRDLGEKQRIAWLNIGPSNPPVRAELYKLITECLEQAK